jgi:hypothetical protein
MAPGFNLPESDNEDLKRLVAVNSDGKSHLTKSTIRTSGCSQLSVTASFLSSIINCFRLRKARETSDQRSKMGDETFHPSIARSDPGKVNGGRSV